MRIVNYGQIVPESEMSNKQNFHFLNRKKGLSRKNLFIKALPDFHIHVCQCFLLLQNENYKSKTRKNDLFLVNTQ